MKIRQAGSYERPLLIIDETASKLSEGLDKAGESYINQQENIRLSKDAIAKDIASLDDSMSEIGGIEGQNFPESARLAIQSSIDELQNLQLKSIGRDQTAVIQKKREIKNLMNQFGIAVGMMDEELKAFKDAVNNGADKKILNSTDPNLRKAFRDMQINGGKNWKMEAVGGNWVMSYKDPETGDVSNINMQNYLNAKENGAGNLIKYTQDKSADYINEAKSLPAYKQVADLTKKIQTAQVNGDDELVTTLTKDLTSAYDNLRNAVSTNTTIQSMIDENDWQNFEVGRGDEPWENKKDQRMLTQDVVTGYIMNQLMPTDAQGNPMSLIDISVKETPRTRATEAQLKSEETKRYIARLKSQAGAPDSEIYTLQTREQMAELGDEYIRTKKEIEEAGEANDVFVLKDILNKRSGSNVTFMTYDDLEALDESYKGIAKDKLYRVTTNQKTGEIIIDDDKPIPIGKENSKLLTELALGGYNLTPAAISRFEDNYKKITSKKDKPSWDAATQKKWDAAKTGDIIVAPDGKRYEKP